jgi:hypothetical protein
MNRSIMRWAVLGALILTFSVASFGQVAVGISVRIGPPPLPVYAQPLCPGPGYIWTPGYWAWDDDDGYYWVPGTWVVAPVGMYWTPGYWGWGSGFYVWHAGYWGPHVGFYGGINYGYGYTGVGFVGGEWRHGGFYYNRSVTNVSVTNVTNVYNRTVIVHNSRTTSFNGGREGVQARPTHDEERWSRERHTSALEVQRQHERAAAGNRENLASQNHGRPAIAATARPGDFGRRSAVAARAAGGEYRGPAMSPREARVNPGAANRGTPNPGNRVNPNVGNSRPNQGFRPFTPPTRSNAGNARGNENINRNQGGNFNRGNENRPVSPPARSNPGNARNNENYNRNQGGNVNRGNEHEFNQNRPPQQHNQQHNEIAPQRQAPRPAPQHSSPPQRPSPPPHSSPAPHFNPPPQHHQVAPPPHQGKGR